MRSRVETSVYATLASLPLEIEAYRLERLEHRATGDWARRTTVVVLEGGGLQGRGEDVTFDALDHDRLAEAPALDLTGRYTLDELSQALDELPLMPAEPVRPVSSAYRRWAFESSALDLALRQAGLSLGEALGRSYRPVRFVVSTRLDARQWLAVDPAVELKLDPTAEWDSAYMADLAASERVRVLDLKGHHLGSSVRQPPDPALYRTIAALFPDAIIEDPVLTPETLAALRGAEDRLSWDAPIRSLADVDALPLPPQFLNVKPSRFGTLARLLECLEECEERGIALYGGGQWELGPGRAQIQVLASLFYPDGPNDVAPSAYNEGDPRPGLPRSPLVPREHPLGFTLAGTSQEVVP